jgi:tRNA nucleotidyltransferase/poly(A) polymerase
MVNNMKVIKKYKMFLESKSDMWSIIPQSVKDLNEIFKKSGKKLYLVGGSVRDFLTGDKPKDFDLATDALPDEVIEMLKKNNYKFDKHGESFGVVVAYTDDCPEGIEIATFREDEYGDKLGKTRNPDVKFSTIEKDVLRRDIPFNAMFYDLDKREIVDLVGGREDLKKGITRFVGDPDVRIEEDALRILRSIRFTSRYGFVISEETKKSIKKNKNKLSIITKERIWEEFKKAFQQSKEFNYYLNIITELQLWSDIFPGSDINTDLVDTKNFLIVVSNLFRNENSNELERKMVRDYKIDGDTAKKVVFLISFLNFKPEYVFDFYKKKVQCAVKDSTILEWLKVNNIDDKWMIKFIDYRPSVSTEELMDKGFTGKRLGLEIKRLEIEKFKSII